MVRLNPSKAVAPTFLAYVSALLYVVLGGIFVLAIRYLFTNKVYFSVCLGIGLLLILLLILLSKVFSWYKFAEFSKYNNGLLYKVEGILGVMGRSYTKYQLHSIDSFKKKGKDLEVKGDIVVMEPMCKPKNIKKVIIYDYTQEVIDLIEGEL